MAAERLQKVLASAGIASRRGAEELIAAGRVTVDGRVAGLGDRADPVAQVVAVDGRRIGAPAGLRYVALHKPIGVTSTVSDPHAARTVVDLVPAQLAGDARLYPVGRLDADSEGLLILTNDGDWAQRILHPRHEIEREYAAGVDRPMPAAALAALRAGVPLEEGLARAVAVRPATGTETRKLLDLVEPARPGEPDLAWYRVTLAQGWKRQVRRMFGTVGAPVRRLVRVRFGTLRIDELASGRSRSLTRAEVGRLAALGASAGARPRPPEDHRPPTRRPSPRPGGPR
jgi:23S rRNA pseudouridine2605 synthase